MNSNVVKAGKLLRVECGECEVELLGYFIAQRDFTLCEELPEFFETRPEQNEMYKFFHFEFLEEFLKVLMAKGLLVEAEHGTLRLGRDSNDVVMEFTPANEKS